MTILFGGVYWRLCRYSTEAIFGVPIVVVKWSCACPEAGERWFEPRYGRPYAMNVLFGGVYWRLCTYSTEAIFWVPIVVV